MLDIFLSLIVPDSGADLARTIAATLSPTGAGMWTTPLAPTADGPATHWISSGWVPPAWQSMVPVRTYEQTDDGWVLVSETPGDQQAVLDGCAAEGVVLDPVALAALFETADVTEQEPFVAMDRLGLVMAHADTSEVAHG